MDQFEEMREQLAQLKNKLNNEEIISDRLFREITKQKVTRLNRNVWQEGLACLFVVTFGNASFYYMGLSVWFLIATTVMMMTCFLATYIPHKWINIDDITSGDLLSVAEQVRRLRKLYKEWIKIGFTIIVPWFIWFSFELYSASENRMLFISTLVGATFGGTVGGIIGYCKSKKLIAEMDDIIEQINGGITITPDEHKTHILYRSNNGKIAGVCTGLSEHLNLSVVMLRICFIVLTLCCIIPGVLLYLAFWLSIPKQP